MTKLTEEQSVQVIRDALRRERLRGTANGTANTVVGHILHDGELIYRRNQVLEIPASEIEAIYSEPCDLPEQAATEQAKKESVYAKNDSQDDIWASTAAAFLKNTNECCFIIGL